jgi:hypothetical protein
MIEMASTPNVQELVRQRDNIDFNFPRPVSTPASASSNVGTPGSVALTEGTLGNNRND